MTQPIVGWKATAAINENDIPTYEEILSPLDAAVDTGKENGQWMLNAFFTNAQTEENILRAFAIADDVSGHRLNVTLSPVHDEDWQEKMKREFPPLEVAGYFIHTFDEVVPEGMTELKIPAGMAFGTGEHPTTSGCLTLFEELVDEHTFKNILDMGCGSAILAMAAAKKYGTPCMAVDIDAPSVVVAQENCDFNKVSDKVTCAFSDGFQSDIVQSKAPYDLIFANILANPLIEMSEALSNTMEEGGAAILSGFLVTQKDAVIKAYEDQGLTLLNDITIGDWVAATVVK
ncbi:MAG: ribosomal protein L11 methyltransferase [Alphaproteobacteria bacterium]|jgi:ribosomal protein L11 methyltransferase